MGEETILFASRYSNAMSLLAQLGGEGGHAELLRRHGADLASRVSAAFDAVEAVHGTGTQAVRDWPEQRKRVLAQLGLMRESLRRSGLGPELRRMASALVALIESPPSGA